jgi:hypothetical protein
MARRTDALARRLLLFRTMSVGSKFKSLFWAGDEAAPVTRPAPTAPPKVQQLPPVATNDPKPRMEGAGFTPAPGVDQLLAAFEAMKAAMPAAQLQIAIAATAKAIGAELPSVAATLESRLTALDASVVAERDRAREKQATRTQSLQHATAKVTADIQTMEERISTLRKELASVTTEVDAQNANDEKQLAAFGERVRGEATRLTALRDFLAKQ